MAFKKIPKKFALFLKDFFSLESSNTRKFEDELRQLLRERFSSHGIKLILLFDELTKNTNSNYTITKKLFDKEISFPSFLK
ncbi:MAG: hypothetical protein AN484_28080 [Aphanizomenon flos-aquae WA102]|uniref:Uncharacterized protein n=1 Tax=Aphanizomenon flos-aquae WA102 TaxID=1710896 RepID=A0A1B7W566_APHFL|nr:MAG: hypothetical protein AN484_28080 [Aphanizomenon flos-aquae WA102]